MKPSAGSSCWLIISGMVQIEGALANLMVVVSRPGSSAARRWKRQRRRSAGQRRVPRNRRRVWLPFAAFPAFAHAFSSRLSSSKKRQSVPSAMIFCGVDLTMPASCSRKA